MKALSIHPYYAAAIVTGNKTIEVRSWSTDYRGDILICSTAKKYHDTIPAHALGVVSLVDVVPFEKKHLEKALMLKEDFKPGLFAWVLDENRLIEPIPIKGKLSLWDFKEENKIKYIPFEEWVLQPGQNPNDTGAWFDKYWKPLIV